MHRMIIDCHGHLVPSSLLAEIRDRAAEFPSVRITEAGGFAFAGGKPTRPVAPFLQNAQQRLEWMDGNGITHQVVGGWLDMFAYEIPAKEGAAWSRLMNRHLKAAQAEQPRFVPLASVPLQDGAAAAEVLAEAMEAGFPGVMIGTQPKGVGGVLDDPSLDPFWAMADKTGAAVFIHPVFESGDNRVHDYGMANAVGRVTDTMIAVSRLLYSGHVLKYRGARIICGIGGSGLPFVLGRLKTNHALDPKLADPEAGLRAMWYDTILQDARALRFLADVVGADRIMLGSDYPFPIGDMKPREVIAKASFSTTETAAMESGIARSLFRL
jgi:aminocarboxymuconate-semialdehyde decarboxylase